MDDPRIPTQLQLRQCDRELLTRIKQMLGDSSMSAAASFVFDCAGEEIVAWLEEGIWLKLSRQSTTNGSQSTTNGSQSTTNGSQSTTNGSQSTTNGSQSTPIKTTDAIDDLDALLGN